MIDTKQISWWSELEKIIEQEIRLVYSWTEETFG